MSVEIIDLKPKQVKLYNLRHGEWGLIVRNDASILANLVNHVVVAMVGTGTIVDLTGDKLLYDKGKGVINGLERIFVEPLAAGTTVQFIPDKFIKTKTFEEMEIGEWGIIVGEVYEGIRVCRVGDDCVIGVDNTGKGNSIHEWSEIDRNTISVQPTMEPFTYNIESVYNY